MDNILVMAKNTTILRERLNSLFERCNELGLTLNQEKCAFECEKVTFIGHGISKSGLKPGPERIKPVKNIMVP